MEILAEEEREVVLGRVMVEERWLEVIVGRADGVGMESVSVIAVVVVLDDAEGIEAVVGKVDVIEKYEVMVVLVEGEGIGVPVGIVVEALVEGGIEVPVGRVEALVE